MYLGTTQQATLHTDPLPGFSLQLDNATLWRFVNPAHTPLVSPFRGDNPGVFYCDLCFTENSTVPYVEVLVEPGDVRGGVRRRFHAVVDAAGLDEDRAVAWTVVRQVLGVLWVVQGAVAGGARLGPAERDHVTRLVSVAQAVQE